MIKPFAKLRGLLKEYDMTYHDLAEKLDKSDTYIARRMVAQDIWMLDECYKILKLFNQPDEALTDFFPRETVFNGRARIR